MRWKRTDYAGWGGVLRATGDLARPERQSALAALSAETPAPAIGNRRSYGDAALNNGGRAIDMTRLDRVLDLDSETGLLTVEAGAMIGDLGRAFVARGWIPPVMPGTGLATVGGCIGNDVHGKNHHAQGSFGQHVAEITLLQGGEAKKITPERNKQLFRATVGGLGQTGIIASAKIRLMPCKGEAMMVTERRVNDWDEHLAVLAASPAPYAVGWLDAQAGGAAFGRGIVEEGEIGNGLVPRRAPGRSVPFNLGLFSNGTFARYFNAAYWRRIPASGHTVAKPFTDFFFPLDRITHMNRLYGKRGFHQFQCAVPVGANGVLKEILELVVASGLASPLAVLKRMGDGRAGHMSFPMAGHTLALDFPNRPEAAALIAELERMAVEAGGRLYFAKDALASADMAAGMYPELPEWRKVVAKADPEGVYQTDLVRRLQLRGAA